jgi:hypothetical protein
VPRGQPAPARIAQELPWILEQLGERSRLRACLAHPAVFAALCSEMALGNYDLVRFWGATGDRPEDIVATYMRLVDEQLAVRGEVW